MTFRAKPVVKRSHKPSWESQDRRNFYLNVGFGIVVVVSVLILVIAVALTYYNDHLASVGSVDGQSISKDELVARGRIETWRLDEAQRRIRTATVAGHMTEQQAGLQQQFIEQQRAQIVPVSLERIIDNRVQAALAVEEGITVTDADIDARMQTEATTKELRHAWVIEVEPEVSDGAVDPTAEQIAAARTKAETALRDIKAGKAWEDVAKTVSTDTSTAPQGGDLGWLQADDTQTDAPFLAALVAAEANAPTSVIEGDDGIFRIGRVTEIAPESVDAAYADRIVNDGLDLAAYREVVRGDVTRQKLEDKIVAEATKPGPQREVAEIFLADAEEALPPESVRVRHILFAPKDDPVAAQSGEIPADDPSWAQAEADAKAAFEKLTADPSTFDAVARTDSDETNALGAEGSGGKLPGYVTPDSGYVQSFKDAVLAPGLRDGQIMAPFKTEFGWHVVQIVNHPPDLDYLESIKAKADAGTDFATLARDVSDASTAGRGGDVGFVARGQLDARLTDAIFAAPIGKTTEVIPITGEGNADVGLYLYKVLAEETRTPEGNQLEDIRQTAFSDWYTVKKGAVPITRDQNFSSALE